MRAAIVLRYYEDMSEPEIADFLGVSRGTVKSTVSRAVAKLRIDTELADGSRAMRDRPVTEVRTMVKPPLPWEYQRNSFDCAPGPACEIHKVVGRAQHDDGCPPDGHVDHAVRDHDLP